MVAGAGSFAQYFPDMFGAGAPMSGAGSAATTTTAAGAGSMALGPWMLGAAGIQAGAGLLGGLMGQSSEREARNAATENMVRGWGFNTWQGIKEKADQMAALREGTYFMQSPIYQQKAGQDFKEGFMLAGKFGFDPYSTGMAARLRGM